MPNTKSAKKRLKQSLVRRTRNRSTKSALKTEVRKVRTAVVAGDIEKGTTELRIAARKLDKAAAHGVIHRNAAARTKSRLSKALKAAKQKPVAAK
jgi:small subunit ribosomal protein S20